jgi:hypothetical protein
VEAARKQVAHAVMMNACARTTLTQLVIAEHVSDAEFISHRERIDLESARLREHRHNHHTERSWIKPAEQLLMFSRRTTKWYQNGDSRTKRLILTTVCSNLTLHDKRVSVEARQPIASSLLTTNNPIVCALLSDIRTLVETNDPDFAAMSAQISEIIELCEPSLLQAKEGFTNAA